MPGLLTRENEFAVARCQSVVQRPRFVVALTLQR